MIAATMNPARTLEILDRVMLVSLLLTIPLLLHAHGIAEASIAVVGLSFLARSAVLRDWSWLRTPWVAMAFAWWGWLSVCSLPIPALGLGEGGMRSTVQALMTVRFIVMAAAMEHCILRDTAARRWLYRLMAAAVAYMSFGCLFQFVFGRNMYGWPRFVDGELTGPFGTPRAGPVMARLMMPAVLPPIMRLLGRRGVAPVLAGAALLAGSVIVMVLIGQRMPLVLTLGSLLLSGLLIRRLRLPVAATCVVTALLLAASPVVAPNAYQRLVVKFSNQMEHFASSHYGLLYTRAAQIGLHHPLTGLGFDGFGTGCPRPENFVPSLDGVKPDGGGAGICWVHPHNFYAQALSDGGFVGLALFGLLAGFWLVPLARGLWRDPDPLRVGLFATLAVQLWPIQSTSGFNSMPLAGWFFLLVGWGMAEARWRSPA